MADLLALKFDSPDGAEQALELVKSLQRQYSLELWDAATVSWPEGAKKPKTRQFVSLARAGALDGAFWGMLFGVIFFVPVIGALVGAGIGALSGAMTDYGISDEFIKEVRTKVTAGTSAIFLLTGRSTQDRVIDAFKTLPKFEVVASNLSKEQEEKMREIFA